MTSSGPTRAPQEILNDLLDLGKTAATEKESGTMLDATTAFALVLDAVSKGRREAGVLAGIPQWSNNILNPDSGNQGGIVPVRGVPVPTGGSDELSPELKKIKDFGDSDPASLAMLVSIIEAIMAVDDSDERTGRGVDTLNAARGQLSREASSLNTQLTTRTQELATATGRIRLLEDDGVKALCGAIGITVPAPMEKTQLEAAVAKAKDVKAQADTANATSVIDQAALDTAVTELRAAKEGANEVLEMSGTVRHPLTGKPVQNEVRNKVAPKLDAVARALGVNDLPATPRPSTRRGRQS